MRASGAMSSVVKPPSCHVCWKVGPAVVQDDKIVDGGTDSWECNTWLHILGIRFNVVLRLESRVKKM